MVPRSEVQRCPLEEGSEAEKMVEPILLLSSALLTQNGVR